MIEIKITVPDISARGDRVDPSAYIADAMAALGYERRSPTLREIANAAYDAGCSVEMSLKEASPAEPAAVGDVVEYDGEELTCVAAETEATATPAPAVEEPPKRKRRTKAEMEAARTAETAPQISTGEARVGPEDDPEVAAQDAADEAAEVEAHRDPQNPLTVDDLRKIVGDFQRKVGFAASVKLVPEVLGCKMAEVPETQEALKAAIDKVQAAIDNGVPAAAEEPEKTAPRVATREEVQAAIEAYAAAYGKTAAIEDRQAIMVKALGPTPAGHTNSQGQPVAHWTVPNIPEEKLGVVVTYYEAALSENPFHRERV